MRNTLFIVCGIVLLILQENLFRLVDTVTNLFSHGSAIGHVVPPGCVPALVFPLVLFMGIHDVPLLRGASISFVLGYATDLIGVAPVGLYTFTYVALFLIASFAGLRLAAQTRWMQALLCLALTLVKSGIILVCLAIFGKDTWVPRAVFRNALPHALATAAFSPLVFKLAERLHAIGAGRQEREKGA